MSGFTPVSNFAKELTATLSNQPPAPKENESLIDSSDETVD
jgi:hypothetical protein